jgi:hypothetical protein
MNPYFFFMMVLLLVGGISLKDMNSTRGVAPSTKLSKTENPG